MQFSQLIFQKQQEIFIHVNFEWHLRFMQWYSFEKKCEIWCFAHLKRHQSRCHLTIVVTILNAKSSGSLQMNAPFGSRCFLILMGIDRPETNHLIFPKFCFVFSISIIVFPPNDWHSVITFFNLPLLPLIFIVIQICLSYISLYLSLGPLDKVCKKYSGLNWKQNCMPKGIKGQLSSNWTIFGQSLDKIWTIFGQYLDNIWMIFGQYCDKTIIIIWLLSLCLLWNVRNNHIQSQ